MVHVCGSRTGPQGIANRGLGRVLLCGPLCANIHARGIANRIKRMLLCAYIHARGIANRIKRMLLCAYIHARGIANRRKRMLHAHGTRNPVPGQSRPGSGEGTANYGFGVQLPGRCQPGGNPVPLAPGPFAGRSRPRSEPGASPWLSSQPL